MWRKALSNYSVYLGSSWWNIYITVMEVLRVIKLVRWVSSLFPHFSGLFTQEKTKMWTKPLFLMMELLSLATASRLSECYFITYEVNATFTLLNLNVCRSPNLWQCRISFINLPRLPKHVRLQCIYMQHFHLLCWFCLKMSN